MKFGKSLSNQIEQTLPQWRDKFLSYKDLKKKLKLVDPHNRPNKRPRLDAHFTIEELDFIQLLEDELQKFNSFFLEKEEEYVITFKELQDRVARAIDCDEEIMKIRKEIVDFHGEMVLLENYSSLNYTGLAKILKKYDKRTGALIRLPFIQKVLQEPFFTTDMLYKLVKECEALLDRLFPTPGDDLCEPSTFEKKDGIQVVEMDSSHMKSTISALRALKEIRSASSTVSVFSLPPLQISGLDDAWKKVPILEQAAK